MLRSLSAMFVVLGLLFAVPQVQAQVQTKAYAPENLRSLSYNDQVRVISLEYSEQSRGRRIPDDQLRFYIDQVNRSNWGFSRIKQDIATSLGGGGGGWNPSPDPSHSVSCGSPDGRYRECNTSFRGKAVLSRNISDTRCVEGQNWGSRSGSVWVDRGCRGLFVEGAGVGGTVRCESPDNRYRECRTDFRGRAVLTRQISDKRCVEGQNWGQGQGTLWVNRGCRGEFGEQGGGSGGGNGYSVTCSSKEGRRANCAWNNRYGRPVLIQQISSNACREGYNWGYARNMIWVDQGCRARFGAQR